MNLARTDGGLGDASTLFIRSNRSMTPFPHRIDDPQASPPARGHEAISTGPARAPSATPQQVAYPDPAAFEAALLELRALPPLVSSYEIESLRQQLVEAAEGRRFLLQGGDCAERFADCDAEAIAAKLKILLQMGLVFEEVAGVSTILVAGSPDSTRSRAANRSSRSAIVPFRPTAATSSTARKRRRRPGPRIHAGCCGATRGLD